MAEGIHEFEGRLDVGCVFFSYDVVGREEGGDRQQDLVVVVVAVAADDGVRHSPL